MSEKRKPEIKIVAAQQGKKRLTIELFSCRQWGHEPRDYLRRPTYRVRVNGKWAGKDCWTVTKVMDQLRKRLVR